MSIGSWHKKIARAAKADPRKAGVLAVLVIVMGLMWSRALTGDGPAQARGALAPNPLRVVHADHQPQLAVPAAVRPARQVDEWVHSPITPMTRNLFAINLDYFPIDASKAAGPAVSGDQIQDEVAKSIKAQADLKTEREQRLEQTRQAAAQLHLQSTITRPTPKAMVEGQMVVVGDTVDGFHVVRITARGMVVERDGIKFEINFK